MQIARSSFRVPSPAAYGTAGSDGRTHLRILAKLKWWLAIWIRVLVPILFRKPKGLRQAQG